MTYKCSSEDLLDFLLVLFHELLLGPGVAKLLGHLVPLVGVHLGLASGALYVILDHFLSKFDVLLSAVQSSTDNLLQLRIQCLFNSFIFFLGLEHLLVGACRSLNRPQRQWI